MSELPEFIRIKRARPTAAPEYIRKSAIVTLSRTSSGVCVLKLSDGMEVTVQPGEKVVDVTEGEMFRALKLQTEEQAPKGAGQY